MPQFQYIHIFAAILTVIALALMVVPVLADCTAVPNGSGSDFHCTNTTLLVDGTSGSDTIVNDGTVTSYLWSGGFSANAVQQDTLINNGVVGSAVSDDGLWGGAGNDTIINNGTVNGGPVTTWEGIPGAIFGDSSEGTFDHDTIINNGISNGNIHGDYSAGGSDTIIINGRVNGGVYGEGPESGSLGRFGNDRVVLTNNAIVTTVIDGMGGNDTLSFEFAIADQSTFDIISDLIYEADPAGDSLTYNGNTYTWVNFEWLENDMTWTGGPTLTPTITASHTATSTPTNTPTPTPTLNLPTSVPNAAPVQYFHDAQSVVLNWSAITWAESYVIEIDDDPSFRSPVILGGVVVSSTSYTAPFLTNGVYYWRVRARHRPTTLGKWSTPATFFLSAPATPTPGSG